jgi:hypothetical protein
MFEPLVDTLEDIGNRSIRTAGSLKKNIYIIESMDNIYIDACIAIGQRTLIESVTDAVRGTGLFEFRDSQLGEHLIRHIENNITQHVRYEDGYIVVFDENIAGGSDVLESGLYVTDANNMDLIAAYWKYGIVLHSASITEKMSKSGKTVPTLEEVISQRISAWGNFAPQWVFLEHGTKNYPYAYPKAGGTAFIELARAVTSDRIFELQRGYNRAISQIEDRVSRDTEEAIFNEKPEPNLIKIVEEAITSTSPYAVESYVTTTGKEAIRIRNRLGRFTSLKVR